MLYMQIVPENHVTNLIDLPCSDECDIPRDCRLKDVFTSVKHLGLLLISRNSNPFRHTTGVVSLRYRAFFDRSRGTGRGIECRNASSMRAETFYKCSLGDQFERNPATQV